MKVGSLFSGIGGLDLGLERAGMQVVWQVENDEYARKVLRKHWPHVTLYGDIKAIDFTRVEPVDLICGGFPCQPVSCAGKRQGDKDERWLWPEFYRAICEARPQWVLVENVPGLLSADRGRLFGGILRDLAASGYDAEWRMLSAAEFTAPHKRERIFLVAHPYSIRQTSILFTKIKLSKIEKPFLWKSFGTVKHKIWLTDYCKLSGNDDGISRRLYFDRIGSLGNAVVPQVAEWIGRRIIEAIRRCEGD